MNTLILQLKKIKKYLKFYISRRNNLLFPVLCIAFCVSAVIVIVSVSGKEKQVFSAKLDDVRNKSVSLLYPNEEEDPDSEEEADSGESDFLVRGDSLSEIGTSSVLSSGSRHTAGAPQTPGTPVTEQPSALTEPPAATEQPTEEPVIEEQPDVTVSPEETEEPEPQVELDPFGPVMVSNISDMYQTQSFMECLKLTGYNSAGDKLSADHFRVLLNDVPLPASMTYNQSVCYDLNYQPGENTLAITVTDDNQVSKDYQFHVFYTKPANPHAIISVAADSIGLGYIIEPTVVPLDRIDTLAYYVRTLLKKQGFTSFSSGSTSWNYRFKGLYKPGLYAHFSQIDPLLAEHLNSTIPDLQLSSENYYTDFIRNTYFSPISAWMFEINGERHSDSLSDYLLMEGDVLRLRFSLAEGADLDWLDAQSRPEASEEPSAE